MKRRVDHKTRLDSILKEAQDLFSELGYPQTSLKLLAKRCSLSRTALYRYYSSKREVFEAVIQRISRNLAQEFLQYIQDNPDTPASEKIRIILSRLIGCMEENTAFLDALVEYLIDQRRAGESVTRRVRRHTVILRLTLIRLIQEGIRNGEFQAVHCAEIAEVFYEMIMGAAMQMSVTETHSPEGFRKRLDVALYALKNCPVK